MVAANRPQYALGLGVWSTSLGLLPIWLMAVYAPVMSEKLDFDEGTLGLLMSFYFVVSAAGGLLAGRYVQSRGWPIGMVSVGTLCAISCLGSGLLFGSVWLLLPLLMIGATANALSQPSANYAVIQSVPQSWVGLAFGIKQAALPITTLVVGVSLPLFGGESGWRWAYGAAASIACMLTVVVVLGPLRRGSGALAGQGSTQRTDSDAPRPRVAMRRELRLAYLLMAIGGAFGSISTMALGGFFVVSAVSGGWSVEDAGRVLAIASLVGIGSRLVSGYLADRRTGRHLLVVAGMMLSGMIGFMLLALGGSGAVVVSAGAILAYGLGWSWNGIFALATVRYSGGTPAVATGIVQAGMNIGGAVGPLLFGAIVTLHSYSAAWLATGACLAVGAVFMLLSRRQFARS